MFNESDEYDQHCSYDFIMLISLFLLPQHEETADPSRPWYLLRLGVIDFLVHWDVRKRSETVLKRTCFHPMHSERVTIIDPDGYARRQLDFLESVFRSELRK
jgi:hypothetical protein